MTDTQFLALMGTLYLILAAQWKDTFKIFAMWQWLGIFMLIVSACVSIARIFVQ
jgi:hypothetical protein